MSEHVSLQGSRDASGCRVALVASQFNAEVTEGLIRGARAALAECGVGDDAVTLVWVPGAFELPLAARRLADTGRFDAIVCLGCVIKGETMHFEYISEAAAQGIMRVGLDTGVPVTFGVLTVLTDEQAAQRSTDGPDNKGREAALAAVKMATLTRRLSEGPVP